MDAAFWAISATIWYQKKVPLFPDFREPFSSNPRFILSWIRPKDKLFTLALRKSLKRFLQNFSMDILFKKKERLMKNMVLAINFYSNSNPFHPKKTSYKWYIKF